MCIHSLLNLQVDVEFTPGLYYKVHRMKYLMNPQLFTVTNFNMDVSFLIQVFSCQPCVWCLHILGYKTHPNFGGESLWKTVSFISRKL